MSDEDQIRNLVARVAQYADGGDIDDYVELFTPDAAWEMPGAPRYGHADIRAGAEARRAAGETGPGSNTRHVITTMAVEVDGDRAVAESYWQFYTDTATAPALRGMGAYRDHLVRSPRGWRLARREITFG